MSLTEGISIIKDIQQNKKNQRMNHIVLLLETRKMSWKYWNLLKCIRMFRFLYSQSSIEFVWVMELVFHNNDVFNNTTTIIVPTVIPSVCPIPDSSFDGVSLIIFKRLNPWNFLNVYNHALLALNPILEFVIWHWKVPAFSQVISPLTGTCNRLCCKNHVKKAYSKTGFPTSLVFFVITFCYANKLQDFCSSLYRL